MLQGKETIWLPFSVCVCVCPDIMYTISQKLVIRYGPTSYYRHFIQNSTFAEAFRIWVKGLGHRCLYTECTKSKS